MAFITNYNWENEKRKNPLDEIEKINERLAQLAERERRAQQRRTYDGKKKKSGYGRTIVNTIEAIIGRELLPEDVPVIVQYLHEVDDLCFGLSAYISSRKNN